MKNLPQFGPIFITRDPKWQWKVKSLISQALL